MNQLFLSPLLNPVTKTIEIPGSKSYTNRALLMASLTENPVTIKNPLFSDDTKAMIDCLTKLGISIETKKNEIIVKGSYKDVTDKTYELNADLAATALRFLLPLLCIIPGTKSLTGEAGLNKRPIGGLVESLRTLGAKIAYLENEGLPPLKITSSKLLTKQIQMKGDVSSQFFSALFMIAPVIGGLTIHVDGIQISKPYIDMTIDSLKQFGIIVENNNYQTYHIPAGQKYTCETYTVEGDFSSAGYFFAIAALTKSTITLKNLNPDSKQADKKILTVLEQMGNTITYGADEITIIGTQITPVTVDMIDFPDQAQTLAVLAAFAKGKTVLTGLQSLHVKETDRLQATMNELTKMQVKTEATYDTLTIYGGDPQPAVIDTYGDQRTAMSFAVAGCKLSGIKINDPDVVNKTFPVFWDKLEELGIKVKKTKPNIVLIGMRGSGKSTVAKLLAKKLNKNFLDMDNLIANKVEMSLLKFVKAYGWEAFRNKESEVANEISSITDTIISTGGGVILRKYNIESLKKNGKFVYLETSVETLLKRLIYQDKNRPALTNKKTLGQEIEQIWKERKSLYEQAADITVLTDNRTREDISEEIIKLLKSRR